MADERLPRMLTLPDDLRQGIERALATTTPARWMREAQALSERYRAPRTAETPPLATGTAQVLGYLALVMPATYAQLRGAMAATRARVPGWQPTSMLDLGSGPGTALWAAAAQWPSLRSMTAWEREPAFITTGRTLAQQSAAAALRDARWERGDLRNLRDQGRYDLVVLGHVLNELDPETQQRTHCDGLGVDGGYVTDRRTRHNGSVRGHPRRPRSIAPRGRTHGRTMCA